jgi:translation elongation factor EF-1alpha
MNIKGLDKGNMPRTGDVMILKSDATLKPCKDFTAQIQTLDIPGEVKAGYSPIGFVRCGRSACKITKIDWKVRGAARRAGVVGWREPGAVGGRQRAIDAGNPACRSALAARAFSIKTAGRSHLAARTHTHTHTANCAHTQQVGKETGGKKLEEPHSLKANEMAQVVFEPCQPLVVDDFKSCEGLSRIAFLDGNTAVMLGKVVKVTHK